MACIGTLEPGDGCRDDRLPPCPQTLRGTLDVDTRRVPDGARRLRLVVTDAAGNWRRSTPPPCISTIGRAPSPPGGAAVIDPAVAHRRWRRERQRAGQAGVSPAVWPAPARRGRSRRTRSPGVATCRTGAARTRGRGSPLGSSPAATRSGAPLRRRSVAVPYGVRVRIRGRLTDRARPRDRPRHARRDPPRARPAVARGDRRAHPRGRPLHRVHPDRPLAGAPVRLLRVRRLAPRPREPAPPGPCRPLSPPSGTCVPCAGYAGATRCPLEWAP